jgi:hypothetical protein
VPKAPVPGPPTPGGTVSALRKILGPLLAAVAVTALMGVVLPASPASAVTQCRWEIEPQPDCPTMPVSSSTSTSG